MALIHVISEVRQEHTKYLVKIAVTDTVTGRVYNKRFKWPTNPSSGELDALADIAKDRIQLEIDYQANSMNPISDEEQLLGDYREIKRDTVLRVRQFPGATLQQAQDYIAAEHPDSAFDFTRLYNIWLEMIGVSTWADFKTWVITKKFRGID